ncbi:MAG: hypothetical protein HY904_04325 [Deltaproteobacteria bacterium]|nr:hypothetical protein [Deltaproteobacteria bacterium]
MRYALIALLSPFLFACGSSPCPAGTRPWHQPRGTDVEHGCIRLDPEGGSQREGAWRVEHADGSRDEGEYRGGLKHGMWRRVLAGGGTGALGMFVDGLEEGPWEVSDETGRKVEDIPYLKGQRHGVYQRFHANGVIAEDGRYVRGRREGPWTWKHAHGGVEMSGYFYADRRDGTWRFRAPDGHLTQEGTFRDGEKTGTWVTYHDDGSPAAREEFERGVPHGASVTYFPGGVLRSEGQHAHGQHHGAWRTWHENGNLATEGAYVDGAEDGTWSYFDDAGRLRDQGAFEMGVRRHLWRSFDDDGHMTLRLGDAVLPPPSRTGIMIGIPRADGTVLANLERLAEPGTLYWVHQSIGVRVPAVLTDVREGNAYPGADPRLDSRAMGVLLPERPLAPPALGVATHVVLVTEGNPAPSPLERTYAMTENPPLGGALGQQVQALVDAAVARELDTWRRAGPPAWVHADATALKRALKKRGGAGVPRDVHLVRADLEGDRAFLHAGVTAYLGGAPVLLLSVDMMAEGGRVSSWNVDARDSALLESAEILPDQRVTPPAPEALFDVDNDGRPELVRVVTRDTAALLGVYELQTHHPGLFTDAVLEQHYGF